MHGGVHSVLHILECPMQTIPRYSRGHVKLGTGVYDEYKGAFGHGG